MFGDAVVVIWYSLLGDYVNGGGSWCFAGPIVVSWWFAGFMMRQNSKLIPFELYWVHVRY